MIIIMRMKYFEVMGVIIKEGNDYDDHDDKIGREGNAVGGLAQILGSWGFWSFLE